jgi:hypothetical protein
MSGVGTLYELESACVRSCGQRVDHVKVKSKRRGAQERVSREVSERGYGVARVKSEETSRGVRGGERKSANRRSSADARDRFEAFRMREIGPGNASPRE